MAWGGIIVYEHSGKYYSLTLASTNVYDGMLKECVGERAKLNNRNLVMSKSKISDERMEDIEKRVLELVDRKNQGEEIDIKGELEKIFDEKIE